MGSSFADGLDAAPEFRSLQVRDHQPIQLGSEERDAMHFVLA